MPGRWSGVEKTQLPVLWSSPPPGRRQGAFARARAGAVGVAGDHVAAVDAEPPRHLGPALEPAAEDRVAGELAVEVGAEEAVDAGDGEREGGAGGARLEPARAAAVGALGGDQFPGRFGGPELAGRASGGGAWAAPKARP